MKEKYGRYQLKVVHGLREDTFLTCKTAKLADHKIDDLTRQGHEVKLLGWSKEHRIWIPISTHRPGSRPRSKRLGWKGQNFRVVKGNPQPVKHRDFKRENPLGFFFEPFRPRCA